MHHHFPNVCFVATKGGRIGLGMNGINRDGAFDSASSTPPGYSLNAGVEFQPASNLSLSLEAGYTQQPGRINSLTGTTPFGFGDRR